MAKTTPRKAPSHLKDLVPDPKNRRAHNPRNVGMIVDALHKVGAGRSIVIDEDNVVLAGNATLEAAAEAGITKVQVVDADGETIIAVRRRNLSAKQKRDLGLFDNRTAELAGWNLEQLREDLAAGEDLSAFFHDDELAALLDAVVEPKGGRTDPDDVPAERATSIKAGDLFELGRHRLLCGDSTSAGDVARLLGNVVPFLMVTDPPYGVSYDPTWRDEAGGQFGDGKTVMRGEVTNDDRVDWTPAWSLFRGAVAYVWHASLHTAEVMTTLQLAGFQVRTNIIWRKPHFIMGRGHYHWQHEPCWYAVQKGRTSKWRGDRSQATIWDIAGMNPAGGNREEKVGHGTQKPVECMERPIRHHGGKDDAIYEPFSGSGTTLIAAERQQRACFAMEITPAYVQMAVDRWEAFTGLKATKVGDLPARQKARRAS